MMKFGFALKSVLCDVTQQQMTVYKNAFRPAEDAFSVAQQAGQLFTPEALSHQQRQAAAGSGEAEKRRIPALVHLFSAQLPS
ncbi:hypothetical protein [Paenibacillus durus]|uniref:Uncharacterized protein n=1 Tax=Paenibacillus durus TaxID=44251 RepID=A0A089HVI0_PAEDU|nr:hypothetical protein [Paenibacillus durus]AIQ14770.1 hypothetical protein PDUR_24995 [Paenibacillus durus]